MYDKLNIVYNVLSLLPCFPLYSHVEDEDELREFPGPSSRADDDPEVRRAGVHAHLVLPGPVGCTNPQVHKFLKSLLKSSPVTELQKLTCYISRLGDPY